MFLESGVVVGIDQALTSINREVHEAGFDAFAARVTTYLDRVLAVLSGAGARGGAPLCGV